MIATGLMFLGMILILNVRMKTIAKKSFEINPDLFKTSPVFNIGAIGIVFIITALYFFFW